MENNQPSDQVIVPVVVSAPEQQNQSVITAASNQNYRTTPNQLREMIAYETEMRQIITEFLHKNMVSGVDFDRIHINFDCSQKSTPKDCKNDRHFSKPTLLKPGAEKFTSLFKLSAVFRRDDETWEMSGKSVGLFCYVCELRAADGKVLSEGRGACSSKEKKENINSAIKIAQKRAQVDATLRFGALSDMFTQDMEDFASTEQIAVKNTYTHKSAPTTKPPAPITPPVSSAQQTKITAEEKAIIVEQKKEINKLCLEYNPMLSTAADYILHVREITGLELNVKNYAKIIEKLKEKPPSKERQKMVESVRKAQEDKKNDAF